MPISYDLHAPQGTIPPGPPLPPARRPPLVTEEMLRALPNLPYPKPDPDDWFEDHDEEGRYIVRSNPLLEALIRRG